MKKHIRRFSLLFFGLLLLGAAHAAELKIGVVQAAKVLAEAPQARVASERIETEFSPRKDELMALQKDIRELEERLQRDGAIMKESERSAMQRNIMERKRDARRSQDEFREDLNVRRNEELARLQRLVDEEIKKLAQEQGFDLILGDAGAVYVGERADITGLVIERLSREFRAGR